MRLPPGSGWAAAVLVAAFADTFVALRPEPAPIAPAELEAARGLVKAAARPGDVLVASPLLSASELAALGDLETRPHRPANKLLAGRRVLVLDRADHPMYFPVPERAVVEVPGTGRLIVRTFEPDVRSDLVVYALADALQPSTLRIERPAGTVTSRCTAPRAEGGFACPGEAEWLYAQTRALGVDGADTPCVWAHPTTGGVVVFELPATPAPPGGRRLQLTVSAGLTDEAVRTTPDGASVTTAIVQEGKELARVVVPNRIGWYRATVNLAADRPVELRVTTSRDGRRHHCVNAELREVVPEPAR